MRPLRLASLSALICVYDVLVNFLPCSSSNWFVSTSCGLRVGILLCILGQKIIHSIYSSPYGNISMHQWMVILDSLCCRKPLGWAMAQCLYWSGALDHPSTNTTILYQHLVSVTWFLFHHPILASSISAVKLQAVMRQLEHRMVHIAWWNVGYGINVQVHHLRWATAYIISLRTHRFFCLSAFLLIGNVLLTKPMFCDERVSVSLCGQLTIHWHVVYWG